ncbi:MAG TPA: hypothetical protein VFX59_16750 [Polyangiales bacterium]|nr:hypothetical protein [Polyangiales bacterium]
MRLSALLAFAVCLLVARPSAHACKCMLPELEPAREDASALFEGRVLAIDDIAGASAATNGEKKITVAVVRTWKGVDSEEKVELYTNGSTAACGYPFAKDASYLIYTRTHEGRLSVSNCSRTKQIADAGEDLAKLGAGATPVKVEPAKTDPKSAPAGAVEVAPATTPDGAGTPSASPPPPTKRGCGAGTHAMLPWLALPFAIKRRKRAA